jgi:alkanesulfonate monooxygenase SsuD/methylene tetrahydromethanopterin reductase-like flavin-dependent oxidoreductase (luciferase family)
MTRVGLVFTPRSPAQVIRTVQVMEECGFAFAGLIDSHSRAMDVYVALSLAAANTTRIMLGPCVTNPVTRDISVTASAINSANLIAPGRIYLGISKGFSGTGAVGVAASKTSSLEQVIPQIRALMEGRPVEVHGRNLRIGLAKSGIPIYMAASGPMALRIAGQVADGAIVHMGHFPDVVADAFGHIRAGAEQAGRDWQKLDLWLYGAGECSPNRESARHVVKGAIAGMGASVFSPNTKGKRVPADLEDAVAQLRTEYAITQHMQPGEDDNEHLIDRLGLTDYLIERFALCGTVEEVRAKKATLEQLGVKNILLNISMSTDPERTIRGLAEAFQLRPTATLRTA